MNQAIIYRLMPSLICVISMTVLAPYTCPAQQKDFNVIISFKAVVKDQALIIGKNYIDPFDETFTIEKFKFYIGNISLTDFNGRVVFPLHPDDYFLIDFTDSASTSVKLSFPSGRYKKVNFLLGVDSLHNVSGAQTDALDPMKGMFWTWNSGYIMAKLEGQSSQSNQPAHAMTYHIGGYKSPNSVSKNIILAFAKEIEIKDRVKVDLTITSDVNAWFSGPHPIHISEIPTCTTPGELAKNISENYVNMFTDIRVSFRSRSAIN